MAAAFCSSCCVVIPCSWSSRRLLHSSAHPLPLNCRNGKRRTRRSKSKSHFSNTPTTPPPSPRKLLTKCLPQSQKESQLQPSESETETEFEFDRLFSNLNQATLKREAGSLPSAIFLVAGTTIGAGILAIPAVTQESGFLASAITCVLCWIYMVSMAMRTVGSVGVQIVCWSYIFIHYALLVAYVARSSEIMTNFLGIPLWESATIFSLLLGGICYFGSQRFVGAVNGVLVFGIIISFAALVAVASGYLQWDVLLKANFQAVPMSIPIIVLSFVYQNVVPVLCTNLEGDLSKVRTAIVLGTSIPLVLFLVWNAVILGTITTVEMSSDKIMDPLQQLQSTNEVVGPIVEVFSLFAIATSYIGFVLGLSDFLSDLLKLPAGQSRSLPYAMTLVPPIVLSLLDPEIFFKVLDFAGTYGVLVLFGILPPAMSWSDRYSSSSPAMKLPLPQLVPGGRLTLSLVVGGAACVIFSELLEKLGHP
ncbi:tyrosine-specific transport protein isoform X3 [Prunus dulcis]|uniref:tyrosine-specific transport protein isoform X3 n=1 Tax=Prunus dulcis TaxID=3755 RepID=UPI001482584D|nr:tyrosine-specific transport protein isoform X3 [Prunus dulcis]